MLKAAMTGCVVMLALSVCVAHQTTPPPSQTKLDPAVAHIDELKAKAERKGEADRGRIYADIAHELVELANTQFTNGDAEKGQASIRDAVTFAEKAATSAEVKGHKIKNAEISLRQTERRMDEVRRSLDLDNQPPLKQAMNRLEELRKQLLKRMFGEDKK